jgi:hypothetical protein
MSAHRRQLKASETTTTDNTPTPILVLPQLPQNGAFVLSARVIAKNVATGAVVVFCPLNSGTIVNGTITQSGGTPQAAPCKTAPADGGTAQGFAPPGCSTTTDGTGLTVALDDNSRVAELVVTGLVGTPIVWAVAGDLLIQSSVP